MIESERGVIILAVLLSMILLISALAVFGLVSGRFLLTRHINKRAQDIRDVEAASYVAHHLIRETYTNPGVGWSIPDSGIATKYVTFKKTDGTQTRVAVTVELDGGLAGEEEISPIRAKMKR